MDYKLALMTGIDIPVEGLRIVLHQPTIKEVSYIGEEGFFTAAHFLCLNKDLYTEDKQITNFGLFSKILFSEENTEIKENVINLLNLLLPEYKILITPQSIILKAEDTIIIDENNFELFQNIIKVILCVDGGSESTSFNPANKKAQEIADKIMKGRQKVAAQKEASGSGSILGRYMSILAIGLGSMSLNDCFNLTLYQVYNLMKRLNLYLKWDIDLKCRLAGGSPKEEAEDWMAEI